MLIQRPFQFLFRKQTTIRLTTGLALACLAIGGILFAVTARLGSDGRINLLSEFTGIFIEIGLVLIIFNLVIAKSQESELGPARSFAKEQIFDVFRLFLDQTKVQLYGAAQWSNEDPPSLTITPKYFLRIQDAAKKAIESINHLMIVHSAVLDADLRGQIVSHLKALMEIRDDLNSSIMEYQMLTLDIPWSEIDYKIVERKGNDFLAVRDTALDDLDVDQDREYARQIISSAGSSYISLLNLIKALDQFGSNFPIPSDDAPVLFRSQRPSQVTILFQRDEVLA